SARRAGFPEIPRPGHRRWGMIATMTGVALVLVHSPLLGPLSWEAAARTLEARGTHTSVPSLLARDGVPESSRPQAETVARAAEVFEQDVAVVLVGHSAAGPLLPACGALLASPRGASRRVAGYLFVDAPLPAPGSWFDTAPPDLAAPPRAPAGSDGRPPARSDWWPPERMTRLE